MKKPFAMSIIAAALMVAGAAAVIDARNPSISQDTEPGYRSRVDRER